MLLVFCHFDTKLIVHSLRAYSRCDIFPQLQSFKFLVLSNKWIRGACSVTLFKMSSLKEILQDNAAFTARKAQICPSNSHLNSRGLRPSSLGPSDHATYVLCCLWCPWLASYSRADSEQICFPGDTRQGTSYDRTKSCYCLLQINLISWFIGEREEQS
jgi:hypothetical protein